MHVLLLKLPIMLACKVSFDEFEEFFRFVPLASLSGMAEHLLLEAKKLGVRLRDMVKGDRPLDVAALAAQSPEAVIRRDYYDDHALMLLCEGPQVTGPLLRHVLEVPGAAGLAKEKRKDTGLLPLEALCDGSIEGVVTAHSSLRARTRHSGPLKKF